MCVRTMRERGLKEREASSTGVKIEEKVIVLNMNISIVTEIIECSTRKPDLQSTRNTKKKRKGKGGQFYCFSLIRFNTNLIMAKFKKLWA